MVRDIDTNCPVCNKIVKNAEKVKFPFGEVSNEDKNPTTAGKGNSPTHL